MQQELKLVLDLCDFGIITAPGNTIGPITNLSFAGIELDSQLQLG